MKTITIEAKLQKLSANTGDKMDSLQFRLDESLVEQYGKQVLEIRKYDQVQMVIDQKQGSLTDDGKVDFFRIDFQALNISISICVTETGQILTMTISTEDRKVFDECVKRGLREQILTLRFTEES